MTCVLSFRNRQRTRTLNLPLLRRITRHLLEHQFGLTRYELGIHLVAAAEMAEVNERFLQHSGSTDVITFDHGPAGNEQLHGEVFVCIPDAVKQARQFRTTWQSELVRYVLHGLLHLQGYDDLKPGARKIMKRKESHLLRQVAASFPLRQLDKAASLRRSRLATRTSPLA